MRTFIQSIYIYRGGAIFPYSDWLSHPPRELATAKAMASGRSDFLSNIFYLKVRGGDSTTRESNTSHCPNPILRSEET